MPRVSFHLPLSENDSLMLILDPHNAQIKYMPQDKNIFDSSSFFNLECQEFLSVTSDFSVLTLLIARRECDFTCSDNKGRNGEVS